MAEPKSTQEETRVKNDTDQSLLVHDFVNRPDMSVNDVARATGKDWETTYNLINDKLAEAEDDKK